MRIDALTGSQSISIEIWPAIRAIIGDGIDALSELSLWERCFHIFWLLGPFFMLIERTPADLWLSTIAILFVSRTIFNRDWSIFRLFWVRAACLFWVSCMLSASLSAYPLYSFGETVAWFRFPLFAMATALWLASDVRLANAMLLSTAFGLIIMCGILTAEFFVIGQQGGRLMWPYGDPLPGSYVAKVGLPVFTVAVALAVSCSGRLAVFSGALALFTLVISLVTGERINFLIRACGGMLAGLLWKPIWHRYLWLVGVEILAVILLFRFMPGVKNRFVDKFIEQLPASNESPYLQAMLPAVEAFKSHPFFGIGPGNFGQVCAELQAVKPSFSCHPHPHNFYVQLLGETGAFGLILGSVFIISIVWVCFKSSRKNTKNVVAVTSWVIPFGLFWPIASTADFFGQWNNIFLWSAVALSLCCTSTGRPNKRTLRKTETST